MSQLQILNNYRKGAEFTQFQVLALAFSVMFAVVFLAVVLPPVKAQETTSTCVGPFKAVASVLADMTGADIC
jgi:O-succinylbenzoate synthase